MGSYAGVDWAADKHDVRVCDEAGEELVAATFVHDSMSAASLSTGRVDKASSCPARLL